MMSKLENVNFCYICDLASETRKQFIKHNISDQHLNRVRKEYEDEVEDETMERVLEPLKTKTETSVETM